MNKNKSFQEFIDKIGCKRCDTRRAELKHLLGSGVDSYKSLVHTLLDVDKDPKVRRTAAWVLGRCPERKSGLKALITCLESPDKEIVAKAADSLGQLRSKQAIPALVALFNSKENQTKHAAILSLGNIQGAKAGKSLLSVLLSADPALCWEAAKVLSCFGSKKVTNDLVGVLNNSSNQEVRAAAAYALGFKGDKIAIEPLIKVAFNDVELDYVRGHALEAIGVLGSRNHKVVPKITELLKHDSVSIRFWAAYALAHTASSKDKHTIAELQKLAKNDNALLVGWWTVKAEAQFALDTMEGQEPEEQHYTEETFTSSAKTLTLKTGDKIKRSVAAETLILANGDELQIKTDGSFKFTTNATYQVHRQQPDRCTVIELANGDSLAFNNSGVVQLIRGSHNIRIQREDN